MNKPLFCGHLSMALLVGMAVLGGPKRRVRAAPLKPVTAAPAAAKLQSCMALITIDTWRFDAIGLSGGARVRTPHLDQLAKSGWYFKRTHTPAPLTTPAHASILTGLDPDHHGIRDNLHFRLKPGVPALAESFRNAGYRTAAFVSAEPVRRQTGLNRGFDVYDDSGQRRSTLDTVEPAERRGGDTLAAARTWLASGAGGASKIFLWVHFYDPHFPYAPPVVKNRPAPASPYIGEIEYVDALIGQLYDDLAGRCLPGATRIALVGDHGESLGEHGETTHGMALYDATLTVPLILSPAPAGLKPPGAFMPSLIDVAPTLRAWAGLPTEPADGVSLLSPQPALPRWLYAEALSPSYAFGVSPAYAMRRGPWVALLHGSPEAYETASDPFQASNLAGGTGKNFLLVASDMLEKRLAATAGSDSPESPDGETLRRLRSLGYVGGTTVKPLTDWKRDDRNLFIRRFTELNAARSAFMEGRLPAAREGYEKFLKEYPAAAQAHQELGVVLIRTGEVEAATRELEMALRLDPRDAITLLSMGNLRAMRGDAAGAEQFYERSLASDPGQPEVLLNYANLLLSLQRKAEALPLLRRFLELAPRDPEAPRLRKILADAEAPAPAR